MPFFRLRHLPGMAWPPVPAVEVSQIWAAYLTLNQTQWLDASEIEQHQFRQLKSLLQHCWDHVPFYRRRFEEAGLSPTTIRDWSDFRRLPPLPRSVYRKNAASAQARQLPPNMKRTSSTATSGTTGEPIDVPLTNTVSFWWHAFYLRDLEWCGIDPRGRLAVIRPLKLANNESQGMRRRCWSALLDPLIESGELYAMTFDQSPARYLSWLQEVDPDYLLSFPSMLELLAGLVRERRVVFRNLRAIQSISETLTDEARSLIESAFGVPVKDTYSCCEAGYLASPCPNQPGYHIHSENVVLEIVDDQGEPCPPGTTGRVLITTLHNFLAPFIRYDVGDTARLADGPCRCGRGLPLLAHIDGKVRPVFRLADGRTRHTSVLAGYLRRVGGHHQHQVIQKSFDRFVLRLVPDQTWSPDHPERFRQSFRDLFGPNVQVDIELRESLERTAGGKLLCFVCEV